jgi:uncharacterized protein YlzI (FlbEa/FlbD family)
VIVLLALAATALIEMQGPNGQRIWLNPAQITNIREPRSETHFAPGTKCLLYQSDGKIVAVVEFCADVIRKLQEAPP